MNELLQTQMKEMERAWEQLQDELRKKEAEYEEKLAQIRQQQTSKVRWVSAGVGPVGGATVQKALVARQRCFPGVTGHMWTATSP